MIVSDTCNSSLMILGRGAAAAVARAGAQVDRRGAPGSGQSGAESDGAGGRFGFEPAQSEPQPQPQSDVRIDARPRRLAVGAVLDVVVDDVAAQRRKAAVV